MIVENVIDALPIQLKVDVFNESSSGKKTPIGSGRVRLSDFSQIGKEFTMVVNLTYSAKKKEEQKGKVILKGTIFSGSPPKDPNPTSVSVKVPEKKTTDNPTPSQSTPSSSSASPSAYLLTLNDFFARDLFDTGSLLDPQDPSLTVTVGKSTFSTKRQVVYCISFHFLISIQLTIVV